MSPVISRFANHVVILVAALLLAGSALLAPPTATPTSAYTCTTGERSTTTTVWTDSQTRQTVTTFYKLQGECGYNYFYPKWTYVSYVYTRVDVYSPGYNFTRRLGWATLSYDTDGNPVPVWRDDSTVSDSTMPITLTRQYWPARWVQYSVNNNVSTYCEKCNRNGASTGFRIWHLFLQNRILVWDFSGEP